MIRYDTQAAYRGTTSRTYLIQAAGRMSGKSDPRRPKRLTSEQLAQARQQVDLQIFRQRKEQIHKNFRARFKNIEESKGDPLYE